ncbi:MAG: ATP synthase F1 subunit epsilon [Magnetococcales bacterium]|nr:ATP synthase F1 subunit epsilon [Magnetococcales bacterium]
MSIVIQMELVTPEALLLSEEAMLVTAPGAEGYFGVMSGHAPFVTLLKPGVLTVGEGDDARHFVVAGGFAEVMPEKVTILTERALPREKITTQLIQDEQKEAQAKLAAPDLEESTIAYWQSRIDFADVCQELLNRPKPGT